MGIIWT